MLYHGLLRFLKNFTIVLVFILVMLCITSYREPDGSGLCQQLVFQCPDIETTWLYQKNVSDSTDLCQIPGNNFMWNLTVTNCPHARLASDFEKNTFVMNFFQYKIGIIVFQPVPAWSTTATKAFSNLYIFQQGILIMIWVLMGALLFRGIMWWSEVAILKFYI